MQSNLKMIDRMEFEEKVDVDDLILPSKPLKLAEIEINNIKQEPIEEEKKQNVFPSDYDKAKKSKLNMEENIFELYEELDKEKFEHSTMNFNVRRLLKIRQFVETIAQNDPLKSYHKNKPFSCKFCDKSFLEVHEVKEHIKIHNSISEVEGLRNQLKSLKTQVKEEEQKLKISQSKMAFQTTQKNELKSKVEIKMARKRKASAVSAKPDSKFILAPKVAEKDPNKTCPICEAVFTTAVSCKRHIVTVHEENKQFECFECSAKFKDKSTLSTHIKGIHMDEKPFNCKNCPKGFTRRSRLLEHESKCSKKENMFE